MTELVFMKFDHNADGKLKPKQAAALYNPSDVILHRPDGWAWGDAELSNPWFRIVRWISLTALEADGMLGELPPVLDKNGIETTLHRRRAFSFDVTDLRLPPAFAGWWADDTRFAPIIILPDTFILKTAAFKKARKAIPDPDYTGVKPAATALGIGP